MINLKPISVQVHFIFSNCQHMVFSGFDCLSNGPIMTLNKKKYRWINIELDEWVTDWDEELILRLRFLGHLL